MGEHADRRWGGLGPELTQLLDVLAGLVEGVLEAPLEVVERLLGLLQRQMSPRLTRLSVYCLRTERRASIFLYISGWV